MCTKLSQSVPVEPEPDEQVDLLWDLACKLDFHDCLELLCYLAERLLVTQQFERQKK